MDTTHYGTLGMLWHMLLHLPFAGFLLADGVFTQSERPQFILLTAKYACSIKNSTCPRFEYGHKTEECLLNPLTFYLILLKDYISILVQHKTFNDVL